jgi:hypothetical protein
MADSDQTGAYCDYLDKEMTIMAILSTFSVAVPAAVLDRVLGAKAEDDLWLRDLWSRASTLLEMGTLAFVLATLAFYLQRSHLASCLGQIRFSKTPAQYPGLTERDLLRDADSWTTWRWYRIGFVSLSVGAVLYLAALFHSKSLAEDNRQWWLVIIAAVPAALVTALDLWIQSRYPLEDHPWRKYWSRA